MELKKAHIRGYRALADVDPDQYQAVVQLAATQNRSISELMRELVDLGFEQLRRRRQARLRALEELNGVRRQLEVRLGIYPGNPVAEARAERERQMETVLSPASAS